MLSLSLVQDLCEVVTGDVAAGSTLMIWAEKQGIALNHIQPAKPQQNAYVERYNRRVRHEWLDLYYVSACNFAALGGGIGAQF